jgi:hypothetical protein
MNWQDLTSDEFPAVVQAAMVEKGSRQQDAQARAIAAAVRAIKQDTTAARLQDEFYDAVENE